MNKQKKVLVVDDDATNRKFLNIVLKKKKIDVIEAENGSDALNKLSPEISMVLLDIFMPVMNGIEFMKNLRMDKPEFSNIPIIVLSTDDTKKQEALSWGATDFITKPVNPVDLLDKISKYL